MKALSIQQPWAWAILYAGKDVENRKWATKFRGRVFIHASKSSDLEGYTFLSIRCGLALPRKDDLPRGGIVGSAEIVDCVDQSDSRWFFGPFGFVLRNATPLHLPGGRRMVECRGALGFFEPPRDIQMQALHE